MGREHLPWGRDFRSAPDLVTVIQLTVLSGARTGQTSTAPEFPFQIGRSPSSHLVLDSPGVWDRHAAIEFQPGEGFFIGPHSGALVSVNGGRVASSRLHNGDLIECGSVKMRFWLAPLPQGSLRPREVLTWVGLAALLALQLTIIYRLVG